MSNVFPLSAEDLARAKALAEDIRHASMTATSAVGALQSLLDAIQSMPVDPEVVEPGEPAPVTPQHVGRDLWSVDWAFDATPAGHRHVWVSDTVVVPEGWTLALYSGALDPTKEEVPADWLRPVAPGETFTTGTRMATDAAMFGALFWVGGGEQVLASDIVAMASWVNHPDRPEEPAPPAAPEPPVTPPSAEVTDRTVRNSAELFTAIREAAPGSKIGLHPGQYADLAAIANVSKPQPVRLAPVDRANPPVFGYRPFVLTNVTGLIFDGLVFSYLRPRADGSGLIEGHGRAINLNSCSDITIRRCLIEGYTEQIMTRFCNRLTIEWNTLDRTQGDAIRVFEQSDDIIIRHNDMKGIAPDFAAIASFHPDYIQFAVNNPSSHPENRGAHRVLIQSNKMIRGPFTWRAGPNAGNPIHNSNSYVQTCSWFHEKLGMSGGANGSHLWPGIAYRDFKVLDNDLAGSHINGIAPAGTIGLEIIGNRIRATPGTPANALPTINLYSTGGQPNENVLIRNNVTPRSIAGKVASGKIEDNIVSATANPVGWSEVVCGHLAYPGGVLAA